ncbi:MAG: hypothetical protein AB7Q81_03850 [Gammaproteobacteria bacterium]
MGIVVVQDFGLARRIGVDAAGDGCSKAPAVAHAPDRPAGMILRAGRARGFVVTCTAAWSENEARRSRRGSVRGLSHAGHRGHDRKPRATRST